MAGWLTRLMSQDTTDRAPFLTVQGYLKDLQGLYFTPDLPSSVSSNLLHNRINARFQFSSSLDLRIEWRNRLFWGDQIRLIPDFGERIDRYNGLTSLSLLWLDEPSLVGHTVMDRLVLGYASHKWDVRLGRQRINWGINTIWNPNDIFNAYNFLDFDYEERPGNDAIRLQHFLTPTSAMDIAWKPGKEKDESIFALMYKFNTSRYDLQVLGGLYQSDWVVGGGWAGHIRDAGFKGEMSYFHPRKHAADTSGTVSFSIMADQTFAHDWYISASFLYTSHPVASTPGNAWLSSDVLSAKQLFPYRYSWYAGVMKAFSPIVSLNLSLIYSPAHESLIVFPSFTWNAATNWDVNLTLQSFFDGTQSAYRGQGHAAFLRIKWSY